MYGLEALRKYVSSQLERDTGLPSWPIFPVQGLARWGQ